MPTPQRIRDEAAAAQQKILEIQREQNGEDTPPDDGSAVPPRDPDTQFGVGQVVEDLSNNDPPPSNEPSGPVDGEAYAKLQQRLATLEGNFSRQSAQLQSTLERNTLLERTLERALERNNERPTVPATPAPSPAPSSVTQAEIDEYGADLTDFIQRLVRDAIQAATTPLLDQIQALTRSLSETSTVARSGAAAAAQTADERYVQRMNDLVKDAKGVADWQQINTMHERGDSRFVDWLQQIGEDSDEPRLHIIQRAYAKRDADKCARMINNFKREVGMADGTKPVESPTPSPAASRAAALVSPSTTGSGSGGAPRGRPPAKTYTQADVEKHYDEKVKGKWKGREAEWQALALDMDKAVLEQRFTTEPRNARGR